MRYSDQESAEELRLRFDVERHHVDLAMLRARAEEAGVSLEDVAVRATIDAVCALRRASSPVGEGSAPRDDATPVLEAGNALRLFAGADGLSPK
jgi:hypothetical protein